jgi:hypothetical protein
MIDYLVSKGYGNYEQVQKMNELIFWKVLAVNNRNEKIKESKLKND